MAGWLTSGVTALVKIGADIGSGGKILGRIRPGPEMGDACMAGLRKVIKMHKSG